MKVATRIGISLTEFWRMTPYEFFRCMEGYEERQKEHYKGLIIQAYYNEALARTKKLPELENLLKENQEQTPEEMLEVVKNLNAMFGGEIVGGS